MGGSSRIFNTTTIKIKLHSFLCYPCHWALCRTIQQHNSSILISLYLKGYENVWILFFAMVKDTKPNNQINSNKVRSLIFTFIIYPLLLWQRLYTPRYIKTKLIRKFLELHCLQMRQEHNYPLIISSTRTKYSHGSLK